MLNLFYISDCRWKNLGITVSDSSVLERNRLGPALFGPRAASLDASRNYDRLFEKAHKARPALLRKANESLATATAFIRQYIHKEHHAVLEEIVSMTASTQCPGIGKPRATGRNRHVCSPACPRWWLGNGGGVMTYGISSQTPFDMPDIAGAQSLLDAMRASSDLMTEQWRSVVHICGCHLGVEDYDENCRAITATALPKTVIELKQMTLAMPVAAAATNRLRGGRDKGSSPSWREQRISDEAEMRIAEARGSVEAAMARLAETEAYTEELEARIASLELGLDSAVDAAAKESAVLRKRTQTLLSLFETLKEDTVELRAEVGVINAELNVYKRQIEYEVGATGAPGKLWVDLRRSYIKHFRDNVSENDFGLDAIRKICLDAGHPEDFKRVAAAAAPIRHSNSIPTVETFQGYTRRRALQQAKEQRVAALWLLTLEGTSQRLHIVQDVGAILSPSGTTAGEHFDGATGSGRPARSAARNRAQGRLTYDKKVAVAVEAAIKEDCSEGKNRVIVMWDDDYTRVWMTQLYYGYNSRIKVHTWTTIAVWTFETTAVQPTIVEDVPIWNPHGFSGSTITWIFNVARPGFETHREWLARTAGLDLNGKMTGEESDDLSAAAVRSRCEKLAYNRAAEAEVQRNLDGMFLVDILDMQFKSYQEMCRALLRQACLPATCRLLLSGNYVESTGDWPKGQLQRIIVMQAYPNEKCPTRGIRHLGELLYASCGRCRKGNAPANMALWKRWMDTCGAATHDEGIVLAGTAVSRIIPVAPGALHRHLNPLTDIMKWNREWFFSPLYRAVENAELPMKLKAKEIALWCELALSGWEVVRDELMPMIKTLQEATPGGRFDITAALHLFETSMPMACFDYDIFTRADVHGSSVTCPDGDTYLNRKVIACQSIENVVRGRENYGPSCARLIDDSLYRQRVKHPWAAYEEVTRAGTQEDKGEGGMHCIFREASQRFIESEAAIKETKRHVGAHTGIDPIANAAAVTLGRKRRLRFKTLPGIADRARSAAVFIRDLWLAMLHATPEKQPERVAQANRKTTGPPSDWFHVPCWPGSPTVAASEVGGLGHALFSAKMGNRYFAADLYTASETGCQMPACQALSQATSRPCGHKACRQCSVEQHCKRCIVPLTARYLYILRFCRKLDLEKLLTVKRLKMSSCYWRKRAVPTAVYVSAHDLVAGDRDGRIATYELHVEPSVAVEQEGDLDDGDFWSGLNEADSEKAWSGSEDDRGGALGEEGSDEDDKSGSTDAQLIDSRSPPPSRDAILRLINQEDYIPPPTAVALPQGRAEKIKILSDMWRDTPATAKEKTRARAAARKKRKAGPIGSAYKIPRNPKAPPNLDREDDGVSGEVSRVA